MASCSNWLLSCWAFLGGGELSNWKKREKEKAAIFQSSPLLLFLFPPSHPTPPLRVKGELRAKKESPNVSTNYFWEGGGGGREWRRVT